MSLARRYPPDLYHGDGGELSAVRVPADREPELTHGRGGGAHYLATGESTGGLYGLYRWMMGPEPAGPAPHFHRSIAESFYVLTGVVLIHDGRGWNECGPGDFVHVPPGGVHGFRNESGEPASMLLHFAPGAPREEYFEVLADAARREAMEAGGRDEFMFRHDTFWV